MKGRYIYESTGDLDRTGRCRECEEVFSKPHAPGCSFGPGKVGSLRKRLPTPFELRAGLVR
jgi:hypothetical protein